MYLYSDNGELSSYRPLYMHAGCATIRTACFALATAVLGFGFLVVVVCGLECARENTCLMGGEEVFII